MEVFPEIGSTNTYLKKKAAEDPLLKPWHTVIASSQTSGKGRKGRSFFSPPGTGLYLSVLLRPASDASAAEHITTKAAVAACSAIEACTDEKPVIKWVNDIFIRGKKVSGILTEADIDPGSGLTNWIIMGIGLNVYEPEGGFPDEIKDIAGAITAERQENLKERITAEFLKSFYSMCLDIRNTDYRDEYRKRCFILGKDINVISGGSAIPARVLDIDEDCHLIVRYTDGRTEALSSGEISVKI